MSARPTKATITGVGNVGVDPDKAGSGERVTTNHGLGEKKEEEQPPSLGPTAQLAARECKNCKKSNHASAERCVFCGEELPEMPLPQPSAPARVKGWVEGPESVRPEDDSIPMSRRAQPSFDEIPAGAIADPLIGVVVADRYRILEPLGRGGMGAVYKVEHIRIGKLLAMKLLTGELSRNPDVVRRFKQEALTASKLSNANTVQVFDFGVAEGLTYLVMELVAGEDLGRTLRNFGPMSPARLGKIIIQVCSSLAEAHVKGIVHRDIKPENIMLMRARDGTDIAKVLDFGLAKLREGTELNEVTSQGAIVGTPYFMAPEQIRGENVDSRTDIYALGALMYRALTGTYPFGGPTPMAVFTKHLTEQAVPPIDRAPELGISPGMSAIVMKMLSKNPNERFAKIEDLQTSLVDEMRASGSSSLDSLLDSGQIRKLQKTSSEPQPVPSIIGAAPVTVAIATRDEVEAYERKLRRQRWGAIVMAGAITMAFAGVGVKLVATHERETFTGLEREPNDSAKEANALPLGRGVSGYLGKRVDAQHADRDFYSFTVPPAQGRSVVSLHVTALPNMGMCTMIYKQGLQAPLGQYCVGRAGRDLDVPLLALEPGSYLASVTEDIDPYGAPAQPFIFENVSDTYTITVDQAHADLGKEIEPNDGVGNANEIGVGASTSGTIGWARDEDVFCAPKDAKGPLRWKVRDGVREAGGVLEATTMRDAEEGAPVRVHVSGKGTTSATDAMSPWSSAIVKPDGATRCLRLRLVSDPWSGAKTTVVPNGGSEAYVIELQSP